LEQAMTFHLLADMLVMLHLLFIIFVTLGGLLVFRWPFIAWFHVPAFLWGGGIAILGWICPLTYLENDLRERAGASGYTGGFIEYYLLPIIYPERLFGDFPRGGFIAIGIFVFVLNAFIYWKLYRRKS
tara:strand:- start:404796 stop:405179 length:384 start_codon:yes stop_codon:yes gene_type:complete